MSDIYDEMRRQEDDEHRRRWQYCPQPILDAMKPCPVCGYLVIVEIKQKRVCTKCRSIIETCCEGGQG